MNLNFIKTFAVLGLTLVTSVRAEPSPPPLALIDAAKSAQAFLEHQKLPRDFFIRSLTLTATPENPDILFYEAKFEPPKTRKVRVGNEPAPLEYQVIVVAMNGVASLQTRTVTLPPRTIRKSPSAATSGGSQEP